jgi:hypothetical protein
MESKFAAIRTLRAHLTDVRGAMQRVKIWRTQATPSSWEARLKMHFQFTLAT